MVLIVLLTLVAVVPVVWGLLTGPGVRTEPVDTSKTQPANTELDGEWTIVDGERPNTTAVGFTFEELLPSDARVTSGTTFDVVGEATIEQETLTAGHVEVDMTTIGSDRDVRDENVRRKLFETDQYPTSSFKITEPIDLSHLPEDGSAGEIEVTGDLTIKDQTHEISDTFKAVRDDDQLLISGAPIINRNEFGVESPEMIAAEIADEGELNIRLAFAKEG